MQNKTIKTNQPTKQTPPANKQKNNPPQTVKDKGPIHYVPSFGKETTDNSH